MTRDLIALAIALAGWPIGIGLAICVWGAIRRHEIPDWLTAAVVSLSSATAILRITHDLASWIAP